MSDDRSPDVKITADPASTASCKFTIDRPVSPERSYFFANREQAQGSPLAERLFEIDWVSSILVSHDRITVNKSNSLEWTAVGKEIGTAIREHLSSGKPAITDEVWKKVPDAQEIRDRVQDLINREINPQVASHGGVISLLDVRDNVVYIQMGGGCQGCGMADVTLKQGIEKIIRHEIPEVGDILDATDHDSGRNPYYSPSKK